LLGKPDDENRITLSYLLSWYKSTNTDAALLAALLQDKPEDEKRIILSNRNFTARSNSATGYSTVRTANYFDIDSPYFEVTVEMLARDGFLMIGTKFT
jgi:hypothetical protein